MPRSEGGRGMSGPLIVYIAGPYRDESNWRREQNIRRAEQVAYWVWEHGHIALCPHTNSRFQHEGVISDYHWIDGTKRLMLRSDAVLTLPEWERSAGALGEVTAARAEGLPIQFLDEISEFAVEFALMKLADFYVTTYTKAKDMTA